MKRIGVGLACLVVALVVASATAGELQWQNLSADYSCTAGQLKLPLTVHERSGVDRQGAVVTSGVPFPRGFLPDASKLAVVDKDGKPVVSQAIAMLKWRKPAYDDSVQWALVSFRADVAAGKTATYYLTDDGKSAPPASPLKAAKSDAGITIDTGAATFVVPMQGNALISQASVGGEPVIGGQGLRGVIAAGEWADRGLKADDKEIGAHTAAGVTVEESGPARVVVCIKGGFAPGDTDKKFYDYTARLYFAAGDPSVRVIYTIGNGHLDPTLRNGGRSAYVWPIKDAALVADLALAGGSVTGSTPTEDGKEVVKQPVAADSMTVFQSSLDGFKLTLGGKELAAGKRHLGVIDAADGKKGVTAARRYFREEWPGSMSVSAKELRVGLFPGEANELFPLNIGQRKSWDIRLTLHGAQPPDLQKSFDVQDALLLFRADPVWMVNSGAEIGAWPSGLVVGKGGSKGAGLRRDPSNLKPPDGCQSFKGGWDGFGVIDAWNPGGWHWNETGVFFDWVANGNGAEFDTSEIPTLWAADHCPVHYDNPSMPSFFPLVGNGAEDHCRLKVQTYPGYKNRVKWGRPDTGHMGMWMWLEYYLLTGDGRVREAVCHIGEMGRGHLWRYTHDDPKDGNGPTAYAYPNYKKRNPEAEPGFKLDRRYIGWPLYCLVQYYQLTGDPEMLAEAKIIAGAFRNTAKANPVGFISCDPTGKDGKVGKDETNAEYSGNIVNGNDGCDSQKEWCHKSASLASSNFYSGIVLYSLKEYYLASKDLDALDTLVGQADRFCQYTLIRTPEGKPAGWSYIFCDYWGPYTWQDAMKNGKPTPYMNSANELTSDAVARLYQITGRADVMDVVQAAVKVNPLNGRTLALHMAAMYPKVKQTPPPAIKDLAVTPAGAGSYKLNWTAPAGAAWYQVKYTTAAKMVELTKGWPDRSEPLPITPADWLAKCNAFNAKQRSFWASNNVAPGSIPKPGPAGAKESMTVSGLPAGPLNIAVKSWDAADNISELSNVVVVGQ